MPLVKVTAELITDIAITPQGQGTELDGVCYLQMCRHLGSIKDSPKHQIQARGAQVGVQGQIPMPIKQTWVEQGGKRFPVPHCSAAILEDAGEYRQHYHKSFPAYHADLLDASQRTKFQRGGGVLKSIRLPLRKAQTQRVVWFAELRPKKEIGRAPASWLRGILKHVEHLGKKTSQGHGLVGKWTVEQTDIEAHWFCNGVLMRTLPVSIVPKETKGKRRSFGGVAAPYWQADFYTDCYLPV